MKNIVFGFVFAILLAGAVFAVVNYGGNNGISGDYTEGDTIAGWVNLSLSGVGINSKVRSNFDGEITLGDLLDANGFSSPGDYYCSSLECQDSYKKGSEINGAFSVGGEKIVGIELRGIIQEVSDFSFDISGDGDASCYKSLEIDLFADDEDLKSGTGYEDEECFTVKRGCFERDRNGYLDATIPSTGYGFCEKISLPSGPAYKLGARVTEGSNFAQLRMHLYDSDGLSLGSCDLPNQDLSGTEDLECIVEYSSSEENDYYVCIKAEGTSDYKLKAESNSPCGTTSPGGDFGYDYDIFAKNLKFSPPEVEVNSQNNGGIEDEVYSYLSDHYLSVTNGINCTSGCMVPVKVTGSAQSASANGLISYVLAGLGTQSESRIYNADLDEAKVYTNGFKVIDLAPAGFVIPYDTQESEFKLYVSNSLVMKSDIGIGEGLDFGITPRFVPFGQIATFRILMDANVSSVVWDFGDGTSPQTSVIKNVTHRYLSEGEFNVSVSVVRPDGVNGRKTFKVLVGDANEVANSTISDYKARVERIKTQIGAYPSWVQPELNELLGTADFNSSILDYERAYLDATEDTDLGEIITGILDLGIPYSVESASSGTLPSTIGADNINVAYIEEISDDSSSDDGSLKNFILSWMDNNLEEGIEFEKIRAYYDDGEEILLTRFDFGLLGADSDSYLIIDYPVSSITFSRSYGQESVSSATSISVGNLRDVEFAIAGDISPEELGAYVSPQIEDLTGGSISFLECDFDLKCEKEDGETPSSCPSDCRPWGTAITLIIIVFIVGAILTAVIWIWYRKYYTSGLFKRKTDLYNITNFIKTARGKGLNKSQIKSRLRKSGWTSDQIKYAFKKV